MSTGSDGCLGADEVRRRLADLDADWKIEEGPRLRRTARLPTFAAALALANRLGALADAQDHHPELTVSWGRLDVRIWSHDVGGLTERDLRFVAAAESVWHQDEETNDE